MSMCESILTIALVCTVKYLHYCDYYYTLGNDSQSTPKLIAYLLYCNSHQNRNTNYTSEMYCPCHQARIKKSGSMME